MGDAERAMPRLERVIPTPGVGGLPRAIEFRASPGFEPAWTDPEEGGERWC